MNKIQIQILTAIREGKTSERVIAESLGISGDRFLMQDVQRLLKN